MRHSRAGAGATTPASASTHRCMGQRGSVTAETALVGPVLVALVFGLLWVVSLGITQARCLDAAREAARALARDDSTAVALTLARRSAPAGAHVRFERDGAVAVVTVSVSTAPPGPVFAALPTVEVSAHAVSALETSR